MANDYRHRFGYVVLAMTKKNAPSEDLKKFINTDLYSDNDSIGWKPFPSYQKNNKIVPISALIKEVKELPYIKKHSVDFFPIASNLENLTEDQIKHLMEKPKSFIYVIDCFSLGIELESANDVTNIINYNTNVFCLIPLCTDNLDECKKQLKKHLKNVHKTCYVDLDSRYIKLAKDKDDFISLLGEIANELITREETETGKGGAPSEEQNKNFKRALVNQLLAEIGQPSLGSTGV